MAIILTAVSQKTKDTRALTDTEMETFTMAPGKMTWKMDLENFTWKTGRNMKVSFLRDKNMEREFTAGKMEIVTKDSSHMTKDKALVSTIGMMEVSTKANGRPTEWMDTVGSLKTAST